MRMNKTPKQDEAHSQTNAEDHPMPAGNTDTQLMAEVDSRFPKCIQITFYMSYLYLSH